MADLRIGSTTIRDVRIGGTQIQKVYAGSSLIWSAYTPISNVVASPASIDASTVGLGTSGTPFATLPSVTWSGSTSATVTWSVVANPTDITINGTRVQAAHTVVDGSYVSGTIRATVSDGTSSAYKDVAVILRYNKSA